MRYSGQTFSTLKELVTFLNENQIAKEDIVLIDSWDRIYKLIYQNPQYGK